MVSEEKLVRKKTKAIKGQWHIRPSKFFKIGIQVQNPWFIAPNTTSTIDNKSSTHTKTYITLGALGKSSMVHSTFGRAQLLHQIVVCLEPSHSHTSPILLRLTILLLSMTSLYHCVWPPLNQMHVQNNSHVCRYLWQDASHKTRSKSFSTSP
jgi:hypothetical protein